MSHFEFLRFCIYFFFFLEKLSAIRHTQNFIFRMCAWNGCCQYHQISQFSAQWLPFNSGNIFDLRIEHTLVNGVRLLLLSRITHARDQSNLLGCLFFLGNAPLAQSRSSNKILNFKWYAVEGLTERSTDSIGATTASLTFFQFDMHQSHLPKPMCSRVAQLIPPKWMPFTCSSSLQQFGFIGHPSASCRGANRKIATPGIVTHITRADGAADFPNVVLRFGARVGDMCDSRGESMTASRNDAQPCERRQS